MTNERYLRLVEFSVWVLAATGVVVGASLVVGLAAGRDLLTVKYVLFGVGFLLFGVGSLLIQPTRPHEMVEKGPGGQTGGRPRGGASGGRASDGGDDRSSDARVDPDVDVSTLRKRVQMQQSRQHRLERKLQDVGPLADAELPYDRRIGRGVKFFVTGLLVLLVSFAMEVAGVQV